jgi:carboxylate-amine ligase
MTDPAPAADAGETLGVEEEYHLVDPADQRPAARPGLAARAGADGLRVAVHGELQTSQIEVATGVCRTLDDVRADLRAARRLAADAADRVGAAVLATSTHPFADWRDVRRTRCERYDAMARRFGALADRQNICGCHVHVAVPDLPTALVVMNRARPYVPILSALTASSPYHDGADTGFASFRTMWWSLWPTAGLPPVLHSVEEFDAVVADLVGGGLIDDASTLYWDVRPSLRYPTVEFRAADVCTDLDDAVLQAALVRSLVRTLADRPTAPAPVSEAALAAARWRAARYGLGGELCDPTTGAVVPAAVAVRRLVERLEPDLRDSGEYAEVCDLLTALLARGTSADRQRQVMAATGDLRAVVAEMARSTLRSVRDAPAERSRRLRGRPAALSRGSAATAGSDAPRSVARSHGRARAAARPHDASR